MLRVKLSLDICVLVKMVRWKLFHQMKLGEILLPE